MKRILHESGRSQFRPVQIAAAHRNAAQTNLAGDADGDQLAAGGKHIHARVGDGTPDGGDPGSRKTPSIQAAVQRFHRAFTGPIEVVERNVAVDLVSGKLFHQPARQRLRAEHDGPQRRFRHARETLCQQDGKVRGGDID